MTGDAESNRVKVHQLMYPVDLPDVSDTELTSGSERYLASLESGRPDHEDFTSAPPPHVPISTSNICRLQLFDDEQPACWVPALHPPGEPTRVVAVRLRERWWCLEDVFRTCSASRSGLVPVQSVTERLMVFLLSQVVERPPEGAPLFRLHPRTESCKVLWRDGRAEGFYTTKHRGSLCAGCSSSCYLLTVLDTLLVRRRSRRRGLGLLMLEDFCSSFPAEEYLGISSPVSPSMAAVLRKFLQQHEEQRERLYEVEAPGGWSQRRNIWLGLQLRRYALGGGEAATSGGGERKEANGSALQIQILDVTPSSSCNTSRTPPRGRSPSGELPGTGSGAAGAHPGGPAPSLNSERPPPCARPCTEEEPHEAPRRSKRVRRS